MADISIDRQWVEQHLALLDAPIPPQISTILGVLVADTLAIAQYARRHHVGGTAVDHILVEPRNTAGCSVWGAQLRAGAADAAFLNACAAEALDFQEVLINPRNNGHAAVVIVPALLALAEQRGLHGPRLLRALWIGFAANLSLAEALGRAHRSGPRGLRTTALVAPIAASLAGAALLSDDHELALHAAAISASALPAGLLSSLSPSVGSYSQDKDLAVGFAARHAVHAVLLAEAGATGPATPLTGEHGWLASFGFDSGEPGRLLGDPHKIDLNAYAIKPWPACFGCQAAIRVALELAPTLNLAQVTCVRVEVNQASADSLSTRAVPGNPLAARFSLPYVVAGALIRGRVQLVDFEPEALNELQVLAFMPRIEVHASAEMSARQQASGGFPARLRVYAGKTEIACVERAGPLDGLDALERQAVFADKLSQLCGPALRERLFALVANPEQIGCN